MSEDKLEQTHKLSGEVLKLLKDKGLSFAEMAVICKAAAGIADSIYTGEMNALGWANLFRKE